MPIWGVASVSNTGQVSLSRWRIFETEDGSRHFVSTGERDHFGRISSAVVAFDHLTLRGTTCSGRVYRLIGREGCSNNAGYVWKLWCEVNNVSSYTDVTTQLLDGAEDDDRT